MRIIIDMSDESIETQISIIQKCAEIAKSNASEEVKVTQEALQKHEEMVNRQRENDRQRIAMAKEGLGIFA